MAWQVQTHSEHNVSAGSNKRHQAHLSPPLSRFIPPPTPSVSLVQLLLACQSVSLPVRPFVSVGLSCGLSFSLLSPPSTLSSPFAFSCHPREPLLSRIYIPVLMCPLSAVLVLASSSTSLFSFPLSPPLSSNLSLSVSSQFLLLFFFTFLTLYFPAPLTAPHPYTGYILNLIQTDTNVENTRGGT